MSNLNEERWQLVLGDPERRAMSTVVKADDSEFLIAYVLREWQNPHQQAEDDARARLIAAAPDLLVALKAVAGLIGEYGPSPYVQQIREEVAAALAKAQPPGV